ncbi:hypothetical protein [Pseudobutyrivibrio sp.]
MLPILRVFSNKQTEEERKIETLERRANMYETMVSNRDNRIDELTRENKELAKKNEELTLELEALYQHFKLYNEPTQEERIAVMKEKEIHALRMENYSLKYGTHSGRF